MEETTGLRHRAQRGQGPHIEVAIPQENRYKTLPMLREDNSLQAGKVGLVAGGATFIFYGALLIEDFFTRGIVSSEHVYGGFSLVVVLSTAVGVMTGCTYQFGTRVAHCLLEVPRKVLSYCVSTCSTESVFRAVEYVSCAAMASAGLYFFGGLIYNSIANKHITTGVLSAVSICAFSILCMKSPTRGPVPAERLVDVEPEQVQTL